MDWSKIKTVLIVTFVIINLILGYSLYGTSKRFEKEVPVEKEVFDKVVALLADKNISVDLEMTSYKPFVPLLTVDYETYILEDEAEKFLGTSYETLDDVAILGEHAVKIDKDTALKYFYTMALDSQNDASFESAQKVAEKFLSKYDYDFPQEAWRIDRQGEFIAVTYKQFHGDYYLDETYMTLEIYDDQVVRFSRKWFQSVLEKNIEKNVLPPSEALFKVIERAYNESITYGATLIIEKMELGYRLNDNILLSSAKSGDASPYWRITFSDGRIIYIEAEKS